MANMAGGMYQQMVVPAPYHYHQPQPIVTTPSTVSHEADNKRKKRTRSVNEKYSGEKKKPRVIGQTSYLNSQILAKSNIKQENVMSTINGDKNSEPCPRCNKKKCSRHAEAKSRNQVSKKTPEEIVIQMKKHMASILSMQDFSTYCKTEQKNGQIDIDISKMHQSYLEKHEPQALEQNTSNDPNKEYKPKVKQWLYRKIFLDEFKTFEYNACKRHVGDLRRNIENFMNQKKKKSPKPKLPPHTSPASRHQVLPQDYSLTNGLSSIAPTDMTRTAMSGAAPVVPPNTAVGASHGYPPPNLMTIGIDTCTTPATSSAMGMGGPPTPALHNSLASYMTQQVPPNLLFGLSQQQHPSAAPAQQQPLNLQTSHPAQAGPGGMQPSNHQSGAGPSPHAAAAPLPLNLHNHPYYVSFGPMLPLHMSPPQHNPQQQFQQNMLQQQQSTLQGGFGQHSMYQ